MQSENRALVFRDYAIVSTKRFLKPMETNRFPRIERERERYIYLSRGVRPSIVAGSVIYR